MPKTLLAADADDAGRPIIADRRAACVLSVIQSRVRFSPYLSAMQYFVDPQGSEAWPAQFLQGPT